MKTHPLNVAYLVVGLIFLGIAGSWALHTSGVIDAAQAGWLLPLTLVVAGAIGLVAFAARGVSRRRGDGDRYLDDQDVSSLEHTAFAPYESDDQPTRTLDVQDGPQDREGEDR